MKIGGAESSVEQEGGSRASGALGSGRIRAAQCDGPVCEIVTLKIAQEQLDLVISSPVRVDGALKSASVRISALIGPNAWVRSNRGERSGHKITKRPVTQNARLHCLGGLKNLFAREDSPGRPKSSMPRSYGPHKAQEPGRDGLLIVVDIQHLSDTTQIGR